MGGEAGGPGAKPPGLGHGVQRGSGGAEPPVYKCTAYKGGPGLVKVKLVFFFF